MGFWGLFSRIRKGLAEMLLTDSEKLHKVLNSPEYIELEQTFKGREEEYWLKGSKAIVKCAALELEAARLSGIVKELEGKRLDLEEELEASRLNPLTELGRHVQEKSPCLVVHFDSDGKITYINPNAESGISYKGQIIGKKPSEILATKEDSLRVDTYFWNYLLSFENLARGIAEADIPFPHNTFNMKREKQVVRAEACTYLNENEFSGGMVVVVPEIKAKGFFEKSKTFAIEGEVGMENVLEVVYHPIEKIGREINYLDFRRANVATEALGTIAKFYQIIRTQKREMHIRGLTEEQTRLLIDFGVNERHIKGIKKTEVTGNMLPHAEGAK